MCHGGHIQYVVVEHQGLFEAPQLLGPLELLGLLEAPRVPRAPRAPESVPVNVLKVISCQTVFFLIPGSGVVIDSRTLKHVSLNTLLFVYLFL